MPTLSRRRFLSTLALAGALPGLAAGTAAPAGRLVILHTNDTHSRIDPMPADAGRLAGLGGVARRARLIGEVRRAEPHMLLLDSGDIFQGTPYFNFFGGEVEFKAMSAMRYDAATLGNHDFDNGVEGLVRMLPHARFPFVSANYDVRGSALEGRVAPHLVRQFGPLRVGIFGLGIAFTGLVMPAAHAGVVYRDPVETARAAVAELRGQGCGLVVCLSHLGYRYRDDQISDLRLAGQVSGIDLILGGHTHTFLDAPVRVAAPDGWETLIHQVGWAGVRLGRIDAPFDRAGAPQSLQAAHYPVGAALDIA